MATYLFVDSDLLCRQRNEVTDDDRADVDSGEVACFRFDSNLFAFQQLVVDDVSEEDEAEEGENESSRTTIWEDTWVLVP